MLNAHDPPSSVTTRSVLPRKVPYSLYTRGDSTSAVALTPVDGGERAKICHGPSGAPTAQAKHPRRGDHNPKGGVGRLLVRRCVRSIGSFTV